MLDVIKPAPTRASASESGRVDEPVNGSVRVVGCAIVVVDACGETGTVVVDAWIVVVDPCGPTGIVDVSADTVVLVVLLGRVVVEAGKVVVARGTDVVVLVACVVVVSWAMLVELDGTLQLSSSWVSSAEPCGCPENVQFVVALTVWVAGPWRSIVIVSVAVGPVKLKSRSGPCWPSITTDSWATTSVSGKLA